MNEIKKVLICGLGAIGSIYASILSNCRNVELKILVDSQRFEKYKTSPTFFNEKELRLDYILPDDNNFKADLIIIATKNDGLIWAIENIKNFINDNTVIMSLLNGVTSEEAIIKEYGKERVLYSYFIGHSAIRHGRKIFQDGVNKIVFGTHEKNENVTRIKDFFEKTGINYSIPDDIIYSMWLKFMLNVSSNQTSAILKMTFGQMKNNEKCMDFLIEIMKEVQKIAKAEGVKNTDKMLTEALEIFATMSPEGKTSMLQDVEAGRKTEVDIFAGTVVELGEKYNIQTPYNKILKELIEAM